MISRDFVVHDRVRLLVPQDRHRDAAAVPRVGAQVDVAEEARVHSTDRIGRLGTEGPAIVAHEGAHGGDGDGVLETAKRAHDEGAVRPWAGERDVQMVAAAGDGKARVGRVAHVIAKTRRRTGKGATLGDAVPPRFPHTFDHLSHAPGVTRQARAVK